MKLIPIIVLAATLASCASTKAPDAIGKTEAANDLQTSEMLLNNAGFVIVGDDRDKLVYKEHVFRGKQAFRVPENPADYTEVPDPTDTTGARVVSRTVMVGFDYASSKFSPTQGQSFHVAQLLPVADRWVIKAVTNCQVCSEADKRMARLRSEAAKRYLTDRGVSPREITISYQAGGDYARHSSQLTRDNLTRRVEIEAVVNSVRQAS